MILSNILFLNNLYPTSTSLRFKLLKQLDVPVYDKRGVSKFQLVKTQLKLEGDTTKLEKAYNPMTIRFFILQAHYRSPLDFSNNA